MNYKIKEQNKKEATLEIVVSKDEFEQGLVFAFNKNKKYFAIPGFRKGKAPRKMVEKYYGAEVLYEDAVNYIIPGKYEEAASDSKLDIVSKPEIDITSISQEEGFVFTAKVFLKPEVEVSEYKGIKAEKPEYTVKSEDVEREIEELKEKTVRMVEKEEGEAVENGDIANINYEGFCDGVAFPGGKGENYDLTIGSGQFIPGFEEQLIGVKAGEEKELNVTFPEEYHAEELKGKAAVFKTKVNKITKKEYAEINDEFAKDVSEFDTLKELKADIKKKLTENADLRAKQEFESNVISALGDNTKVEIPDCMIEERIDTLVQDFEYRLKSQGLELKKYFEITGLTEKSIRDQYRENAKNQVKVSLAIEKVAELEKIEATDEEVEEEYKKMAESYGMEADKIKTLINSDDLKADLRMKKAVKFIVDNAVGGATAAKKATKKATAEKETEDKEKTPKKAAPKKTTAKKTAEKEEAPKKTTVKKTAAKKTTAKKTTKKDEE